jgi:hypothetical protein
MQAQTGAIYKLRMCTRIYNLTGVGLEAASGCASRKHTGGGKSYSTVGLNPEIRLSRPRSLLTKEVHLAESLRSAK